MNFLMRNSFVLAWFLFLSLPPAFAVAAPHPAMNGQPSISSTDPAPAQTANTAPSSESNDCISVSPSMKKNCDLHATITEIVAPDAPAFTVLGLNPANVSKPNTPAELAADVINAFDNNGHFQSGAALDVVPFLTLAGRSFSLGKYAPTGVKWSSKAGLEAYGTRLLARTSVSFATVKGTSTQDSSLRMATGFRVVLLDNGDPRAAFQRCASDVDIPLDPLHPDDPARQKKINEAIENCRKKAKRVWNASSLTIAGAPGWISTDGSVTNLQLNGGGFWASLALGLSDWGQLIVTGRRETGENVVPPNNGAATPPANQFVRQDTSIAGGAFRAGRSDFNCMVQGLYIGKRTGGLPDSYPEFGFGVEKKLAEKVYLEINYRYDNTSAGTSALLANLKWSFSQEPKLAH